MKRARVAALGLAPLLLALPASAQTRLQQDALDLQARSNVVQGAGARAYGMGGAFLARPDDATAASWNPAGLSYLRSPEVSFGGTHTSLRVRQRDPNGDVTEEDPDANVTRNETLKGNAPEFAAATFPFNFGSLDGAVQLGYQRSLGFDGKRTIVRTEPNQTPIVRQFETHGGFDVIALGAGVQATRRLRLGLTVNRWLNGYGYTSERVGRNPTRQTTDFELSGWNLNLGMIWSPIEQLNLGAVYKTGFTADANLKRSRIDFNSLGEELSGNSYASDRLRLDIPAAFGVGASWRPSAPLTLSADYTLTKWSNGRIRNYFTLPQTGTPQPPDDLFPELPYPTLSPGSVQKDSNQLRTGLEYVLIKGGVKWPIRLGYFADRQLERRYNEQSGRRDDFPIYHAFTAGTGLVVGSLLVDVAYVFQLGSYRDADPEAEDLALRDDSFRSHRVFVSLIYRHKR